MLEKERDSDEPALLQWARPSSSTNDFEDARRLIAKTLYSVWLAFVNWPVGLMDKASASGAGDSRLESWAGHSPAPSSIFAVVRQWTLSGARSLAKGVVAAATLKSCVCLPSVGARPSGAAGSQRSKGPIARLAKARGQ